MDEPERTDPTVPGPASPPVQRPEVGAAIDDFLLVDRLGEGAFATVYLAHQTSMRRTVALKVAKVEGREAQTLAQLDHPGIVRVYDQRDVPAQGVHLIYMEYVAGGTLEGVVSRVRATPAAERSGRLLLDAVDGALAARGEAPPSDSLLRTRLASASWPEAVCIVGAELAEALDYAHRRRVIHHDVKPGNVLLAPNGRAKLADFNVSSERRPDDDDAPGPPGGTLLYMAPEQLEAFRGALDPVELDGRADLYALGVLLWELWTGERPLRAGTGGGLAGLVAPRPASPRDEAHDTDLLRDTLGKALAFERDERPETGGELARRLDVCRDPDLRRLFATPPVGWRRWVRNAPFLTLLATSLLPNLVLSVLNIAHNLQVVAGGEWSEFQDQVSIVNALMYGVGIVLGTAWVVRVTRVVRAGDVGVAPSPAERATARSRALTLGGRLAWLLITLWSASGVIFAVWRHARAGEASLEVYLQFTVSLLLFGVLAATLCYFVVQRLVSGVFLPALVVPGEVDAAAVRGIRRLARRATAYFAACTAVPFVSVVVLALQPGDHRSAFLALGLLGALGFALTLWLGGGTRRDYDALARALEPTPQGDEGLLPSRS